MRWDNPITPDWFTFPDLAAFPDYAGESRNPDTAVSENLLQAITAQDKVRFLEEVRKYTNDAHWLGKLNKHFSLRFNYQPHSVHIPSNMGWRDLFENGIHVTSISFDDLPVQDVIDQELARKDWNPQPGTYDRGQFLSKKVLGIIQERFEKAGLMAAASAYSAKQRHITAAFLHVSMPTDKHYKQFFMDAKTTPRWTNTHIDPKEDVMKAIIYLDEIGLDNGPFGYVPKSNRFVFPPLTEIFGRAISTGNYCKTPQERESVFALPANIRVSYNFGRCILDGSYLDKAMEKHFMPVTSDMGNVMVFDAGAGMHQGGVVKEGRRLAIQVLMK